MKQDVARQINRVSNMLRRKMNEFSAFTDLTFAQSRALYFILRNSEEIYQKDIEEEYMLRPPTASELLKSMEQIGLLRRESSAADGRRKRIVLTDKALVQKELVEKEIIALEECLTSGISPQDMETFFRVTEQMLSNLEGDIP